jgi:hypothetical protein
MYDDGHKGPGGGGASSSAAAGLTGGLAAAAIGGPGIVAAATGGGGQGGGGGAATPTGPAPFMNQVTTIGGAAAKTAMGVGKTAMKGKKAVDELKGKTKHYDLGDDGIVHESVEKSAIKKELGKDDAEKTINGAAKTLIGASKGASKAMDSLGVPVSDVAHIAGVNPLASAANMASGTRRMVKGTADVARHEVRGRAAGDAVDDLKAQGDLLHMGMKQNKNAHKKSRNEAARQTAIGAGEAATGALGIAQYCDPSGVTAGVHAGVAAGTKAAKKGNAVRNAVKKGFHKEDVASMRKEAKAGNPAAKEWLLTHDGRTAANQELYHAQVGSDESQERARGHIGKSLGLGGEATDELANVSVKDYHKLRGNRTGQDVEGKLSAKESATFNFLSPVVKPMRKFFGGGPKADAREYGKENVPEPGTKEYNEYFASEAAKLTFALDKEKELKAGGATEDEQAAAFKNVDQGVRPVRQLDVTREFDKSQNYVYDKMFREGIDKQEQKSLKSRHKGGEQGMLDAKGKEAPTGELYNADNFADEKEMVQKTFNKKGAVAAATDKVGKKLTGSGNGMPEDVLEEMETREAARRRGDFQAGHDLPSDAPADGWQDKQKSANREAKAEKKGGK